jgi:catechol 2,3-dioxygenase-like lactoylglutathione lyase family enzyme
MEYLHTMIRVTDLADSLDFYINKLGLVETQRMDNEAGRYTLVFLAAPDDVDRATQSKSPAHRANLQLGQGNICRWAQFWPSVLCRRRYPWPRPPDQP